MALKTRYVERIWTLLYVGMCVCVCVCVCVSIYISTAPFVNSLHNAVFNSDPGKPSLFQLYPCYYNELPGPSLFIVNVNLELSTRNIS